VSRLNKLQKGGMNGILLDEEHYNSILHLHAFLILASRIFSYHLIKWNWLFIVSHTIMYPPLIFFNDMILFLDTSLYLCP